ncbi:isoaspartyl peptidase L-asparaginase [Labeo rohita]|uniref:Isoaspartyl peptidase L-asparaginase n=1 Tax=Labeo rohita TaxID=84645 RepID=A0A498NFQ9_LABRO|nr:isoaspartyl peptidase L-asparaginase [Labeo rohita]RXN30647.1 isoaspartyl peptidase L-asparaginase [Labeo rohita]
MLPVVAVHGGAGHIPKERAELSTIGVKEAARTGYAILQKGGSAMDAVVEAVALMENNPRFNAGKTPEEASDLALTYMKERVDGLGGVVVVDSKGNYAARFSSKQMSWAAAQQGELHYGLYRGEHFVEPVQENMQ